MKKESEDWDVSFHKIAVVARELVKAEKPLRSQELWQRCQQWMSKATFAKACDQAVRDGCVIRTEQSRKNVTYAPNSDNMMIHDIQRILNRRKHETEERLSSWEEDANEFLHFLAYKTPSKDQKKKRIQLFLKSQANALALAVGNVVFYRALTIANQGNEGSVTEGMLGDEVRIAAEATRDILVRLCNIDLYLASKTFTEWGNQLGKKRSDDFFRAFGRKPPKFTED